MESMLSVRGKKLLVVENYTFRRDKETGLGVSYRCTRKSCWATISVDKSEQVLLQTNGCHNHPCVENLRVKKLQNEAKWKAMEDISQPASEIINLEIKQGPAGLDLTTKDLENIRKTICRSRRSECKTNKEEDWDRHAHDAPVRQTVFTDMRITHVFVGYPLEHNRQLYASTWGIRIVVVTARAERFVTSNGCFIFTCYTYIRHIKNVE
ncbi:hypothetical protein JTB14_008656 [Gonioctena quinquepunctata]|nr:hypothetical protein JTB14_008656 [Gonioctena quinquepunctata]